MATALTTHDQSGRPGASLEDAVTLLSQQLWCWGQDILRPQGNWLIETGFTRTPPPEDRGECASLYTLTLPGGRTILLRGFGVFYGDPQHGCIYLPRYKFQPFFTKLETLDRPPWSPDDLPRMSRPAPSKRRACHTLVTDLIDWIWRYEAHVAAQLGVDYREHTLIDWDDGRRPCVPAEEFAQAWRGLLVEMQAGGASRAVVYGHGV